jgi:Glycosyl hydrolases family 38 N-terminal domain
MSTLQQRRTAPSVEDDPTINLMSSMPSVRKGRSFNSKRSKWNSGNLNVSRYPSSVIWGTCVMILIWCLVPWFMIREGYWSANGRLRRQNDSNPQGTNLMSHSSFVVDKTSKLEAMSNQSVAISETDLGDKHNQQQIPPKVLPNYRKLETEVIDMRIMSATLPFDDVDGGVWKQGWDLEPKKITSSSFSSTAITTPLQIFVVPHSHCDPGWIKTFDDYFRTQTSQILTSVIQALAKDKRRKFIWAEISYFEWWWREQSNDTKETVKQLLKNRQLEFVTGGWVQPDEANTQLYAMEVQLQEGHSWIRNNVGEQYIPKYGWSIDPFGYSPTMAYLLRKYDFEGMLIQRVHYAVKKELASKQQLEFLWR